MNTPNVSLMRAYGTDADFKKKTANVAPIAHRIAEIAMGHGLLQQHIQGQNHTVRHTMQAEMMNTAFRMLELARMGHAIDNADHFQAPIILPAGYGEDMPLGMTEGMIRMASAIGGNMAKEASMFRTQGVRPSVPPEPVAAAAQVAAPAAAPVANAASQLGDKAHALWHRSGLSNGAYKYKLPALAAAGAVTLGGLAALKKVKSYMEEETPARAYRNAGNQLAPDINDRGYTQPEVPHY